MRRSAHHAQLAAVALITFAVNVSHAEPKERIPSRLLRDTVASSYLYPLASWTGPLRASAAPVTFDASAHEAFVVSLRDSTVHVFNQRGMETFAFGDDAALPGAIISVAALPAGDLVAITRNGDRTEVVRCNFRGQPRGAFVLTGLPQAFTRSFSPAKVIIHGDTVYLVDLTGMMVVAADANGAVKRTVDLGELLAFNDTTRANDQLFDLYVDARGVIYFTIPTLFRVYVLDTENHLDAFGGKGSSPGLFNVVSGVTADEDGNIYVTDVLRAVVMVFDRELNFRGEFGYRGPEIDNLVAPRTLAVGDGKVFVSQSAERGVSVFGVRLLPPRREGETERTRVED